jgi:hypothetical protein
MQAMQHDMTNQNDLDNSGSILLTGKKKIDAILNATKHTILVNSGTTHLGEYY